MSSPRTPEPGRRPGLAIRVAVGFLAGLGLVLGLAGCGPSKPASAMLVMDPLAKELACPCVGGYAQRNYRALAAFLSAQTGTRIEAVFADELGKGLRLAGRRPVVLIVGKDSVVRYDTRDRGDLGVQPWFRLTDRDGRTTQTGLFVVRKDDPAKSLTDVRGRRFFFGPEDSEEKHQAALVALKAAGVPVPGTLETRPGCTESAAQVVESEEKPAPVGVISSYALPLLEGCGSVPAGELRVLAETGPVPFITCFATAALPSAASAPLQEALRKVREQPELLKKLESRDGFEAVAGGDPAGTSAGPARAAGNRAAAGGEAGGGGVAAGKSLSAGWFPERLTESPHWLWRQPLSGPGLAGIAVAREEGLVLVADRDPFDERDVFLAFRASDGELAWQFEYRAVGDLDYGQSPRATPVVREGRAYLLGAFGHLACVSVRDGKPLWRKELARDFGAAVPKWGYASTPLWVEGRLILNPGANGASLVALDPKDGRVLWKCPGGPAAYASFVVAEPGGRRQIVGYDQNSLGGWDPATGRRLWRLVPPQPGDFNVPTPLVTGDRLLVVTENNGTRLHAFGNGDVLQPEPLARAEDLRSETASPVLAGGLVVGWDKALRCLDPADGLREVWKLEDAGFGDHAALLAGATRVLASTQGGELLLVDVAARPPALLSRLRVAADGGGGYASPALEGNRLFLRDERSLRCLSLE